MMLSMLTDPSLADVCLVVEGEDVPAHKAVLGEDFDCLPLLDLKEASDVALVETRLSERQHRSRLGLWMGLTRRFVSYHHPRRDYEISV